MIVKLNNTKETISNIIEKILTLLQPITTFITSTRGKYFLLIYLILMIISIYVIQVYKSRKLKQQEYENIINNSSRNEAIESFNNYNQQIIQKLSKECNDVLEDSKYNPDTELNDTIAKKGLFYFNIEENYKTYILKNLINKNISTSQINIIDNILLSLDTNLSILVNKNLSPILDAINNTDNFIKKIKQKQKMDYDKKNREELKYVRIDNINNLYVNIIKQLDDNIILELENESSNQLNFNEDYGLTINETPLPKLIKNELYERFYYKIYLDYKNKNIFKQLCKQKKKLTQQSLELNNMFQKSYDTDLQKQKSITNLENDINISKADLIRLQNKYELYLRTLEMFSTSRDTINKLKKQLLSLSNTNIQPANENIIDYLNTYKNNEKSKLSSSPFILSNTEQDKIAESLTTNKLNALNKQYEDELKAKNSDTRLDIIKMFSDTETNVIGFLDNIYNTKSRNNKVRFDNDLSDRGTWLKDNTISKNDNNIYYLDNNLTNNINEKLNSNINEKQNKTYNLENKKLKPTQIFNNSKNNKTMSNQTNNKSIIEEFNNIENDTKTETKKKSDVTNSNNNENENINATNSGLPEQVITQFLNITKSLIDNETINKFIKYIFKLLKLDNIKTSEQFGVMLVIVSALLFFIDLSS